ncbi:MAG: peptidoglycan-associated lipoprotein Pal [Rhodospirillales bacterium]|jgi:peptidoglycan-associated lipoprotein
MRLNILSIFAVVALLTACETAPDGSGSSSGAGGGSSATSGSGAGEPRSGTQEDLVVNVGDRVFFGFNKFKLNGAARGTLDKQAAWLKKFPSITVVVEGHADERGTREYNLALGERRANSAKDYLVTLGVSPSRIKTISYGEERPVALGSSEKSWSQNRRSVSVVSRPAS